MGRSAARFEAGTPPIAEAIGLAAAFHWLDASGMDATAAHEREIAAYALERLAEVPGLRVFGPPPARTGSASSRSSSRASTPTTSRRSSIATASRSAPATTARSP